MSDDQVNLEWGSEYHVGGDIKYIEELKMTEKVLQNKEQKIKEEMKIIYQDIFTTDCNYILHQTNCLGIAGRGLALQIRNNIQGWYADYKEYCHDNKNLLGTYHIYKNIISIFGQLNIGTHKQQTDYNALEKAFKSLKEDLPIKTTIAIPYKFACGLAGGNWETVKRLIEEILEPYFIIKIYKLK